MIDNPELALVNHHLAAISEALIPIGDELGLLRRAAFPPRPAPRAATNWPWAPGTIAQGFLSGRWNRRDGNSYATASLRGVPGPNSPIRGGDDSGAQVDVPSGARRS